MSTPAGLPGSLRPVDRVIAAYNVLLALLWAAVAVGGSPAAEGPGFAFEAGPARAALFALAHGIGLGLAWALCRRPVRVGRAGRILREAYPLLLIPLFYLELDPLIRTMHDATWDGAIIALDHWLFGVNPDRVWIHAMPQHWFSELMHFSYWVYLPLIFVPAIVVAVRRDAVAFQDVTLRLIVAYLACQLVYIAFPTAGPLSYGLSTASEVADGFFFRLVHATHESGSVYGAAFPSSHVAGAVTVAWLGWKWLPRGIAAVLTVQALGVLLSTIYTQNHYAVDALAGLVAALALQAWAVPAIRRIGASRRCVSPLPSRAIPPRQGVIP